MSQPIVTLSVFCQQCGEEVTPCTKCEKHDGSSSFLCFSCERSLEWEEEAKEMSSEELYEALDEVDYDRRKHCVRLRGLAWTKEDQVMHDNMDKFALIIWTEIERRRRSRDAHKE